MPVIMKSDIFTVIRINTVQSNNRAPQVSADVFNDRLCVAKIRFCKDIEAIGIFFVNMRFRFSEGRANTFFHFVKKCGLERFAEKGVVEMLYDTPKAIIGEAAFRNQAVNMRIPFKGTAESMKNTDKTGYKVF